MITIKTLGREFELFADKEIDSLTTYEITENWITSIGSFRQWKVAQTLNKINGFTLKNRLISLRITENETEPNPLLTRLKRSFFTPEILLSFDESRQVKYKCIEQNSSRYKNGFLEMTEKDREKFLSIVHEEIKDTDWKEIEQKIKEYWMERLKEVLMETKRDMETRLSNFAKDLKGIIG